MSINLQVLRNMWLMAWWELEIIFLKPALLIKLWSLILCYPLACVLKWVGYGLDFPKCEKVEYIWESKRNSHWALLKIIEMFSDKIYLHLSFCEHLLIIPTFLIWQVTKVQCNTYSWHFLSQVFIEDCWAACKGSFYTYRDWLLSLNNSLYLYVFLLNGFWTLNCVSQLHHSHYLLNLAWNNSQLFLWVRFTPKVSVFTVIPSYLHLFVYKHVSILSIGSDSLIFQEYILTGKV